MLVGRSGALSGCLSGRRVMRRVPRISGRRGWLDHVWHPDIRRGEYREARPAFDERRRARRARLYGADRGGGVIRRRPDDGDIAVPPAELVDYRLW